MIHYFSYIAAGVGIGFGGAASFEVGHVLPNTQISSLAGTGLAASAFAAIVDQGRATTVFGSSWFSDIPGTGLSVGWAVGLGVGAAAMITRTEYNSSYILPTK